MILINILLVNKKDEIIGKAEKIKAHKGKGLLHRAFSVFVFYNDQLLIQKRNKNKYHSGGLWSNTCCSHPTTAKNLLQNVKKRLEEEMGFTCDINYEFKFKYEKTFSNKMTEKEIDYVFIGNCNKKPNIQPNPTEVEDWKWIKINKLRKYIKNNSSQYTYWFKKSYKKVYEIYNNKY